MEWSVLRLPDAIFYWVALPSLYSCQNGCTGMWVWEWCIVLDRGWLLRRRRGQISDRWRRNCSIMIIALTIIIARSKLPSFWRSTFFRSLCWFELTRVVISPHCCCSFLSGSYSGRSRLTLCAPLWPMDNTRSTTSWLSTRRRRRRRRSTTLWLSKQARSGFLQLAQSILVIRTLCANC